MTVAALALAAAAGALALGAGSAAGTTGAHPLASPPRYPLSREQGAPYVGHFQLADPHDLQLVTAAYVAEFEQRGFLEGSLVVYTYDAEGKEVSWIGTTYEYHAVDGGMTIDVVSPNNQVIFGRLKLRTAPGGELTGSFRQLMPEPEKPQQITLAPVAAPESGPAEAVPSEPPTSELAPGAGTGIFATAVEAAAALAAPGKAAE